VSTNISFILASFFHVWLECLATSLGCYFTSTVLPCRQLKWLSRHQFWHHRPLCLAISCSPQRFTVIFNIYFSTVSRLFRFEGLCVPWVVVTSRGYVRIDNDLTNNSPSKSCPVTWHHIWWHLYLHLASNFGTNHTFTLASCSKSTLHIYFDSKLRPCLVHSENQKVFKISRHIESCGTCMKH